MPSFNIVPNIPPRRVSLPEFDYGTSLVVIYILIVLIIISYSKVDPQKGKLWSYTTIILSLSLVAFIFTNIWIQIQPSLGFTPSEKNQTIKFEHKLPIEVTVQPYFGKPPTITVTDDAKKSSIGGIIIASPGHPINHKELVLYGTTTDGDMKFATLIATTFTDFNGKYSFAGLQPGKYSVQIVEKRDDLGYETYTSFYKNRHEVIIGVNEHITDYNYDYSNPY